MKIMCSGGICAEAIDHSACLDCALAFCGLQPCGLSYPLLKALYAFENGEERREAVHVTDLTTCLLKSWYEKTQPLAFYPHERLVVFLGKAVHKIIEDAVKDDPVYQAEQALEGYGVTGRLDLIGQRRVVDIKTTRWLDSTKPLPYGNHRTQVETYAALVNASQDSGTVVAGQIQYVDMSGPTTCRRCRSAYRLVDGIPTCPKCGGQNPKAHLGGLVVEFPVSPSEEVTRSLELRAAALRIAIESESAPDPEPGWICDYCSYQDQCPEWA